MIKEPRTAVVNDAYSFDITSDHLDELDISQLDNGEFHAIIDGQSYSIEVLQVDYSNRSIQLKINDAVYSLSIQGTTHRMIESMGYNDASQDAGGQVNAPMPGLVLDILASEGQSVEQGDHLCILEAMKMENILKSPLSGTIESIVVKNGDSVNKGDLIISITPH